MPSPPSRIGRYEIKSPIGRGGMGNLYLAHDPSTDRLVAIKRLDASLNTAEFRQRFVLEAKALAALNHPHIVDIYDTGEYEGTPYFVMEYVRGETLADIIRRRAPVSLAQRLKWMTELCAGLAQAHEANIIHRDIKPANLILDRQGKLKILDFGIARVEAGSSTVGMRLTRVDTAIGTPGYMSPEQLEGGDIDHRSDLFSAGAVGYELFTYTEAFPGRTAIEIERQVIKCRPEPLTVVVPGLDHEFDDIVLRALKRDPNKRYQDASTLERDLERLRARIGASEPRVTVRPTPPPGRGKTRELRAEEAYQRALAAYRNGEIETARQYSVEALSEDPLHKDARELLAGLAPPHSLRRALPSTAARAKSLDTVVSTTIDATQVPDPFATRANDDTAIDDPGRRLDATRLEDGGFDTISDARTLIVQPVADDRSRGHTAPAAPPRVDGRSPRQGGGRVAAKGKLQAFHTWALPLWPRASRLTHGSRAGMLLVAAAVGAVLLAVAGLSVLPSLWTSTGPLLTIVRPENGTLVAEGIRCGSRGSDCTATMTAGQAIELLPVADDGFVFSGYQGDCAPMGRLRMDGPHTCGATFERATAGGAAAATPMQTMTISPVPQGGTVDGVGIKCGSQGTVCTAEYPQGELAVFKVVADDGYTFMGFTGECGPTGQTEMSIARTCGARFERTDQVERTPVRQPAVARGSEQPASGNARDARPSTRVPVSVPPGEPPTATSPAAPPPSVTSGSAAAAPPEPSTNKTLPQTAEEFARERIAALFARWCAAYVEMSPEAVQQVFPKVDVAALRLQLNSGQYKSVQCSTGELNYSLLDAQAGRAALKTDVTWVFGHTVTNKKEYKQVATFTLIRMNDRTTWLIDSARFQPK